MADRRKAQRVIEAANKDWKTRHLSVKFLNLFQVRANHLLKREPLLKTAKLIEKAFSSESIP